MKLIISNAGVHPALSFVAEEAARRSSVDVSYFTSGSLAADSVVWKVLARSRIEGTRVGRAMRRRRLPADLGRRDVHLVAAHRELAYLLTRGASPQRAVQIMVARAAHFDRSVAQRLSSAPTGIVVAQSTASQRTLASARHHGHITVLNAPIVHPAVADGLLAEEARLTPHWAGTLPRVRRPDADLRSAAAELRFADHVFCAGGLIKKSYESAGYPAARIHTLPLGIDPRIFRPRPRREDGIFRVIFAGQLTQRKGLSYLVEAFEELRGSRPRQLVLVGSPVGDVLSIVRRYRDIRVVPSLPKRQLSELYSDSDVFVLPSLVEGFAQTPLEAMACGLPVIVSENMDMTELVTDWVDGVIVPIRDSARIGAALERLAADRTLRLRIGARAAVVARAYTWERFARSYVDELLSLTR